MGSDMGRLPGRGETTKDTKGKKKKRKKVRLAA
jgi:hypothetical protein